MKIKRRNLSQSLINWLTNDLGLGPGVGDVFFLCASSTGNDYLWLKQQGVDSDHLLTSFSDAYSNLTANRNDTLIVMPGSHTLSAVVDWAKSYTHMIGAGPIMPINSRCRLVATTAGTPLFTLSANGCLQRNVMISQDGSHASSYAVNTYITGARNRFEAMTWRNLGALNVAGNACRTLVFDSSDGENTFDECTIGADTVDAGTATNYVMEFAASALGNQRQIFRNCRIIGNGSANASFIKANAANCINGSWILFDRCLFTNPKFGDLDEMTQGFALSSTCNGLIYMMDCLVDGCATYETSNSGVLIGRNAYAAATTDSGVALTF